MKISEQWLRESVNPAISSAELAEQLTMAGLEVDSIKSAAATLDGVVVGRVLHLAPHSESSRLQVAKVDVGRAEPVQIVCGAPDVVVGMHAPTALVGATLPNGVRIEKSSIRGIESQGMLCSAQELGLAETADGLLRLPDASRPGQDLSELLALDDQVIEVDLTPNRGDCLSISGIAREVGVINRCEVSLVDTHPVAPLLEDTVPVEISAPADCPRYVGRVIRGVNPAAETPLWMRERLRRSGLRSLGPLVDVTNYVMLELGQPMHAFDLGSLSGGIIIRRACSGEKLLLLNGAEVELDADTLVIADHEGPVALAGIMGGELTAVGDKTHDLFLESAFFHPVTIGSRARNFGLQTDSSHRFERGVDPQLQVRAAERATQLLLDIVGGSPGPIIEVVAADQLPKQAPIRLRSARIALILGFKIPDDDVAEILQRLGMTVTATEDGWSVIPPNFRFDIGIEVDLIEDLGRIYGYSRLPSNRLTAPLTISAQPEGEVSVGQLREILVQRGYQEAITYSFVDPVFQKVLDPDRGSIALSNPISADLSIMRTNLWPGLVKALVYNQKRQQARVRLFESGLCFVQDDTGGIRQELYIGGVICGDALPEQWGAPRQPADFFDLKDDVEALLAPSGQSFSFTPARHPALHPGQSAHIQLKGKNVGWIGALHPAVERELDIDDKTFVFELSVADICQGRIPRFAELSKFPAIRRDIAVVVNEAVSAQAVEACIRNHVSELLREMRLFDVYRGRGIPENHKSMAFGLILQDFSRTLIDEDVDKIVSKIVFGLKQQLGATLRV